MKKSIISGLSAIVGAAGAAMVVAQNDLKKQQEIRKMSDKHLALYLMMNQWVKVKQQGKNVASYLEKRGYARIAIYGMGYVGETLVEELKGSSIEIAYGIDKNAENLYCMFDICTLDDNLDEVDAVIVTPIFFFDEIEEKLSDRLNCPIISLEDILYEV